MNIKEFSKSEILEKLYSLHRFGIKPGLERTLDLLDKVGNPHLKIKTIHVAGTNGKGSICSSLASIYTESGYKTGLYTSPHIFDFNERIRINGKEISDDKLVELASICLKYAEEIESTFFEITTVMAFLYFYNENVDLAIIETGMGGNYDSTNVLNPLISIICKIDIDHIEYLGDTLELIASEKAGIIKSNTPLIYQNSYPSTDQILIEKAKEKNTPFFCSSKDVEISNITYNHDFTSTFDIKIANTIYQDIKFMSGNHQLENIKSVIYCIELLKDQFPIKNENVKKALVNLKKNSGLKSRIQFIDKHNNDFNVDILCDVSHNPASVAALESTVNMIEKNLLKDYICIFAVMFDKDSDNMIAAIRRLCNRIIICQANIDRALDLDNLEKKAQYCQFEEIILAQNPNIAFDKALETKRNILILGSFYLIGSIDKLKSVL